MKPLKRILPAIIFAVILIVQACSSNEIGESKDVAQDKIYQQYSINYKEGNTAVRIFSQFRFAGKNGTTLVLDKPSQVSFDDETIKADSSTAAGAYYQVEKPAGTFFGPHHFIFTDVNNKKLENTFSFDAFKLISVPGSISKKQVFRLPFSAAPLAGDDYIEVDAINTDSSFSITHAAGDAGNFISIPVNQLKRQKGNGLTLQATLHRFIPLQQNTAEGGKLSIEYALKPVQVKLVD